jgi:putative tricarboxylic transport membrane protein
MFDGLFAFGHSLASFMTLESVFMALASSLVGVIIGALPGLTATMGVALMTTLTIKLPSSQALLILICTYVGAIYGGSRSAILLNIPAPRLRPPAAWTATPWRAKGMRAAPWALPPPARCWAP